MIKKCPSKKQRLVFNYLEKRFGIKRDSFNDFNLYTEEKGKIFLGPKTFINRCISIGLVIARIDNSIEPSNNLLQTFGKYDKKNFILLNKEDALSYIKVEDLEFLQDEIKEATEGYVLLKYSNFPLGCGLLKGKHLKNMLPKAKRLKLEFL